MKFKTYISQNKSRGGFTLVEMLVVIGMIAALAGISFPVYRSIQKKVERTKFEMDMNSLVNAVDNFETEYNYLPYIGAAYPAAETLWKEPEIRQWITVLAGGESTVNFKQIKFFEASDAEGNSGNYHSGLITNSDGTVVYFTPWGTEISRLKIDHDLDGVINHMYGLGNQQTNNKFIYCESGPNGVWCHIDGVDDDLKNFDVPLP